MDPIPEIDIPLDPRSQRNYCTKTIELREIIFDFPAVDESDKLLEDEEVPDSRMKNLPKLRPIWMKMMNHLTPKKANTPQRLLKGLDLKSTQSYTFNLVKGTQHPLKKSVSIPTRKWQTKKLPKWCGPANGILQENHIPLELLVQRLWYHWMSERSFGGVQLT